MFWNLIGIHFWGCVGHNCLLLFLPTIAMARGLGPGLAATIYAALNASSVLTRFAVPVLADRIGSKKVMVCCFSIQSFPVLLLFFAQDAWAFFLFAVLFGVGVGGEVPIFPVINRQYYGHAPMGTLYGWQNIGNGVGMALGPILGASSGPGQATIQGCSPCRSVRAWPVCCPSWPCPAPPAACSLIGRSSSRLRPGRAR